MGTKVQALNWSEKLWFLNRFFNSLNKEPEINRKYIGETYERVYSLQLYC